jgi:NAD+ kinase
MKIESIGVCMKPDPAACAEAVSRVVQWCVAHQIDVLVDRATNESANREVLPRAEICARADLLLSVGGDGTLLSVARAVGTRDVPILGLNLGTLGFLTEVNQDEIETCLDLLIEGKLEVEERMRLEVSVFRDGKEIANHLALNDVVVTKTALSRMIDLVTLADGKTVTTYHADGLILSTPTGSTAYSLSAAGPILLPGLEAIVLTPICPHSLNQRPLVLSQHTEIEVELRIRGGGATLTVDGQEGLELNDLDRVVTRRSPHPVRIVASGFRTRFEILHSKLHWGNR